MAACLRASSTRQDARSRQAQQICAQLNNVGGPSAAPRPRPSRSPFWDGSTGIWRIRSSDSESPGTQLVADLEKWRKDLAHLRRELGVNVREARRSSREQQQVVAGGDERGTASEGGSPDNNLLEPILRSPLLEDICSDTDWLRQQELISARLAEAQSRVLEARQNTDKAIKHAAEARRRSRGLLQRIAALRGSPRGCVADPSLCTPPSRG